MLFNLKTFSRKTSLFLSSATCRILMRMIVMASLFILCRQVFASEDPLAGTEGSIVATLGSNGTARKFIYLVEGISATATYIKTKNVLMFSGVVAIAVFLNVLFKVAGVTA